jgi:hypothetical protein
MEITIEQAVKLRADVKAGRANRVQASMVANILFGEYDRYKDKIIEIAREDMEFLSGDT